MREPHSVTELASQTATTQAHLILDNIFEFNARDANGAVVPSALRISSPVASRNAFYCVLRITGFMEHEVKVHGAFSFQATDLTFSLARVIMASHESRWSFIFREDEEPVTFSYRP